MPGPFPPVILSLLPFFSIVLCSPPLLAPPFPLLLSSPPSVRPAPLTLPLLLCLPPSWSCHSLLAVSSSLSSLLCPLPLFVLSFSFCFLLLLWCVRFFYASFSSLPCPPPLLVLSFCSCCLLLPFSTVLPSSPLGSLILLLIPLPPCVFIPFHPLFLYCFAIIPSCSYHSPAVSCSLSQCFVLLASWSYHSPPASSSSVCSSCSLHLSYIALPSFLLCPIILLLPPPPFLDYFALFPSWSKHSPPTSSSSFVCSSCPLLLYSIALPSFLIGPIILLLFPPLFLHCFALLPSWPYHSPPVSSASFVCSSCSLLPSIAFLSSPLWSYHSPPASSSSSVCSSVPSFSFPSSVILLRLFLLPSLSLLYC